MDLWDSMWPMEFESISGIIHGSVFSPFLLTVAVGVITELARKGVTGRNFLLHVAEC